jgi:hypothetical protein
MNESKCCGYCQQGRMKCETPQACFCSERDDAIERIDLIARILQASIITAVVFCLGAAVAWLL